MTYDNWMEAMAKKILFPNGEDLKVLSMTNDMMEEDCEEE